MLIFKFLKDHPDGCLTTVLVLFLVLCGVSWLKEHDSRLIAEQKVQQAQTQIDSAQKQYQAADAAAKAQITVLKKQAATVKTPAQAIAAIPDLTDLPLNTRPAPGLPNAVIVDAVPLFDALNQGKQDAVNLAACTTKLDDEQKIDTLKDTQIAALEGKQKHGFWKRLKKDAIDTTVTVGIGLAVGYGLHH